MKILRLKQPDGFFRRIWTGDSKVVVFEKNSGELSDGTARPVRRELWALSVAGGPARKLDIDTNIWLEGSIFPSDDGFALSPDGRQIAFLTGYSADEVWVLKNFPACAENQEVAHVHLAPESEDRPHPDVRTLTDRRRPRRRRSIPPSQPAPTQFALTA